MQFISFHGVDFPAHQVCCPEKSICEAGVFVPKEHSVASKLKGIPFGERAAIPLRLLLFNFSFLIFTSGMLKRTALFAEHLVVNELGVPKAQMKTEKWG